MHLYSFARCTEQTSRYIHTGKLNFSVKIMVLDIDVPGRKTRSANIDGLVIVYLLLALPAVYRKMHCKESEQHITIECKYWPPLWNVTGQCPSWRILKKNFCTRLCLCPYLSRHNDARKICCICSVPILLTGSRLPANFIFSKDLERVSAFFLISLMLFGAGIPTSIHQSRKCLTFSASTDVFFLKVSNAVTSMKLTRSAGLAFIVDKKWVNRVGSWKGQR